MQLPKIFINNSGNILIELLLACALFSLIVSTVSQTVSDLTIAATNIQVRREMLVQTRNILDQALKTKNPLESTTFTFSESTTTVTAQYISPCISKVSAETQWQSFEQTHSLHLTAFLGDSDYLHTIGNDCNGIPIALSSTFSLFFLGTTSVSDIDFYQTLAFISLRASSPSDPSLMVVDESDINNPSIAASSLGSSLTAVDVTDQAIFTTSSDPNHQLQIYSFTPPHTLVQTASSSLPGVAGSFPGGSSLYYYDNFLYIGTHRTAGNEFHIFDVHDITHPLWRGSIELNHNINSITIRGSYAYLGTSGNTKNIIILDIHDPTHIREASSFSFPGSEDTTKVMLVGPYLFAGRLKATTTNHDELWILNISSSTNPQIVSSLSLSGNITDLNIYKNSLLVSTTHSFLTVSLQDPFHPIITNNQYFTDSISAFDHEGSQAAILTGSNLLFKTI